MKQRNHALGARIKAAMKAAGFKTAKQFCEKHNIPYLTFAQHLQGRRNPTSELLKLYSKAFGVTMTWLKTGEGNPLTKKSSTKSNRQKKIEKVFENEMKGIQFHTETTIDPELLSIILEEIFKLKKKFKLSEKKCASFTANLYAQVIKTTQEKELQKNMASAFIKTYEATFKI